MKAYLVTPSKTSLVDIDPELETYYKLLECDTIDIVYRKIGDRYFDVICDDEALLKAGSQVTCVDRRYNPMLFGNLLLVHHDEEGSTLGLEEDDIPVILRNVYRAISGNFVLVGDY